MLGHGQTVARRLGDPDAARYDRLEDHLGEVLAQLALDVLGEAGALVVHGDQQTRHVQRRVQLAADHRQRVEELDQALERQVLGLDRDDHPVGGDQRVDADRAERGRAVEQREGEALADRAEPLAQARLRALDPRQLDRGAGQVAVGGNEPEVVGPGGPRRLGDRDLADQAVVGGRVHVAVAAQRDGRVALRVEVDEQRLGAGRGDAGGDVDRGRRLADSALLVRDRVDDAHGGALPCFARMRVELSAACARCRFAGFRPSQPRGRFFAMPGRRGRSPGWRRPCAARGGGGAAAGVGRRRRGSARGASPAASAARSSCCLLVGVALALPGDQDAAFAQQRGGQLGEGREAADGAGRHRVVGLAAARRRRAPRSGR